MLGEEYVESAQVAEGDDAQVPTVMSVHGNVGEERVSGRKVAVTHQALERSVDPVIVVGACDLLSRGVGDYVDGEAH